MIGGRPNVFQRVAGWLAYGGRWTGTACRADDCNGRLRGYGVAAETYRCTECDATPGGDCDSPGLVRSGAIAGARVLVALGVRSPGTVCSLAGHRYDPPKPWDEETLREARPACVRCGTKPLPLRMMDQHGEGTEG